MIDEFTTPDITVLGEQDGPDERRLKEALGVVLGLDRTVIRPTSPASSMTARPPA